MGGIDKGLQRLDGKPLVQWAIERLAPQVDTLIINANRNLDEYARLGYPVVPDKIPGFAGPLAGLHAALVHLQTQTNEPPWIITVPCDSPYFPLDLVIRLSASIQTENADLVTAQSLGRKQVVFGLYRPGILNSLNAYLTAGGRKVQDWHATLDVTTTNFDDQPDAFRNLNTADDWP